MQSKATTVSEYLESLPEDRKKVMAALRKVIKLNLPKGFEEVMSYGMIGYVVPFKLYPDGYHCNPDTPLPFMSLASQKNFIALYHMGMYADEKLPQWFQDSWKKHSTKKLDMGKSCIRFKKPEDVPLELIGELVGKMTPKDWISQYEKMLKK
jgi:Domain of unknown function (DU1801)